MLQWLMATRDMPSKGFLTFFSFRRDGVDVFLRSTAQRPLVLSNRMRRQKPAKAGSAANCQLHVGVKDYRFVDLHVLMSVPTCFVWTDRA